MVDVFANDGPAAARNIFPQFGKLQLGILFVIES
jgi:hypothetical protein